MRQVEGKQPLVIPLSVGMDEEVETRGAQPGVLYAARNCRIRTTGSLQKRCGTIGLTGVTNVPLNTEHSLVSGGGSVRPTEHPSFFRTLGDQVIAGTTAGEMFSNDLSTNWEFAGCFSSVLPLNSYALTGGASPYKDLTNATNVAVGATSDGYVAGAYQSHDNIIRITIREPAGRISYQDSFLPAGGGTSDGGVRIVVVSNVVYVLWNDIGVIYARGLTITSGGVSASADTVVGTNGGGGQWDTSSYDGTNWFFLYNDTTTNWRLSKMAGLSESSGADIAVGLGTVSVASVWADPTYTKVWIGMLYDITGAGLSEKFAIYNATSLAIVSALADIDAGFTGAANIGVAILATPPLFGPRYSGVSPTSALCVLSTTEASGGVTVRRMHAFTVTAAGSVSSAPATRQRAYHMLPLTKPDAQQRVWCRMAAGTSKTAGDPEAIFLIRCADAGLLVTNGAFPVEAYAGEAAVANLGFGFPTGAANLFHAVAVTPDKYVAGLSIVRTSDTNGIGGTDVTLQAMLYEYSTASVEPDRRWASLPLGFAISGQPTESTLSGVKSSTSAAIGGIEIGFPHAPVIIGTTSTPDAVFGIAAGTYAYIAVMQWYDTSGRRQLSAVSDPKEVTILVPSQITLNIAFPTIGQRPMPYVAGTNPPIVLVYRTTNGGENYQLIGSENGVGALSGVTVCNDLVSDTFLAENEFIYTDGGVLPNVMAPTCRFMATAEDRVWCGGLWDPRVLEASKVIVPNEPINFTGDASHQIILPEACTGLAYMDGQVVAFAQAAIYLLGGDGPNDEGAGSFLPPRMLTRGVGCINYRSVLETAIGIIFQSAQGIYLLPRGFGAPQYIGIKVQDTLLANPVILSAAATTSSEYRLARFLVAGEGVASSTTVLTLDIDSGNWFADTYDADDGPLGGFAILGDGPDGCAMVRNTLTSTATPIWYEDETRFYDEAAVNGTTFVGRYIETAWVAPFGPAGWGRVNKAVLVTSKEYGSIAAVAKVSLSLEIDTDLNTETFTWAVPATGETLSYRGFDITRRDCTLVRGIITESANGSSASEVQSRGPKFLSLNFEIEPDGGLRMLTESERSQ